MAGWIEETKNGQIYHVFHIDNKELRDLYLEVRSSKKIAAHFGVDCKTILTKLQALPDWNSIKGKSHALKTKRKRYTGYCLNCERKFTAKRKQKYCNSKCGKLYWQKNNRKNNRAEYLKKRRENSQKRTKRLTDKQRWKKKFLEKVKLIHKRNLAKVVDKIIKRSNSAKSSMVSRSKKAGVVCDITLEEIRELIFESYGNKCKYCDKILNINTMVFDHIIPVSKGGPTTKDNLQIICKTSNTMKGSLNENHFNMLLEFLDTVPPEVKRDISIRLARGIH